MFISNGKLQSSVGSFLRFYYNRVLLASRSRSHYSNIQILLSMLCFLPEDEQEVDQQTPACQCKSSSLLNMQTRFYSFLLSLS